MCIAIGKPMGVECPSKDILATCFKNNDDGAGFAFAYRGEVFIKKGYMSFENFYNAFDFYNQKYNFKKLGVLIHFRIATHGNRDASMTHPFPISSDDGALKKIEYHSKYAVVHNGIIGLTSSTASRTVGLSDTALFIKDYLEPISQNNNWFNTPSNIELIYKLIDSKMAILNANGEIIKTAGFVMDNGVYYSNTTYKENRYHYTSPVNNYTSYTGYYENDETYLTSPLPTTTAASKGSKYIKLCRLDEDTEIIVNGELYPSVSELEQEESYMSEYFIDSENNMYIGYIDSNCACFDELYEDYLWIFEKIGRVDKFLKDGEEVKLPFICNTVAYPDQITTTE